MNISMHIIMIMLMHAGDQRPRLRPPKPRLTRTLASVHSTAAQIAASMPAAAEPAVQMIPPLQIALQVCKQHLGSLTAKTDGLLIGNG
jgi:hypothetical protein